MEKEIGKNWSISYDDLDKIVELYRTHTPDTISISKYKKPINLNKKKKNDNRS